MNYLIGLLLVIASWILCAIFAKIIDKSNEKQEWYIELSKKIDSDK